MPAKVLACLLLALILLATPGCFGSREMDQTAYVVALGLDVGRGDTLEVSFEIANPKNFAGKSSVSAGKSFFIASAEAPSLEAAVEMINSLSTRLLSLEEMKALYISEKLAQQGVGPFLLPVIRFREFRGTAFIYVGRGRTSDLMQKNNPLMESSPAKQYENLAMGSSATGLFPFVQVNNFVNALASQAEGTIAPLVALNPAAKKGPAGGGSGSPAPGENGYLAGKVPRLGGNPLEITGTAVFNGDRMVGRLNGEETRMLLMLRGDFNRGMFTLPDPHSPGRDVVLLVHQRQKPSVTVESSEQGFRVKEKIYLEYDLQNIQSGQTYECLSESGTIDRLLADYVKNKATGVIQLAQRRYRSDILRWGLYAAHTVPTWQEWEKLDWPAHFPGVTVDLSVSATMRRPGMLLNTGADLEGKSKCLSRTSSR